MDPVQVVWGTESPSFTWYTRTRLVNLSEKWKMKTKKIRLGILCCRAGAGGLPSGICTVTCGMEELLPPCPGWSLTGPTKAWKMNCNNLVTDEVISIWKLKSGVLNFWFSCLESDHTGSEMSVDGGRERAGPATCAFTDLWRKEEIKEQERCVEEFSAFRGSKLKKRKKQQTTQRVKVKAHFFKKNVKWAL